MGFLLRSWFEEGRWLELKDLNVNPDLSTPEGRTENYARAVLEDTLKENIAARLFRVKYNSPAVPIEYQLWKDTLPGNRLIGAVRFHRDLGVVFDEMTFDQQESEILRETHSRLPSARYQTVDDFLKEDGI
ncbi:MAG: hypothetical protein Q7R87_00980 [Nanoarchaeota archaeon]|nr:hypothetical protein [Nanoarchaeota archaeon]